MRTGQFRKLQGFVVAIATHYPPPTIIWKQWFKQYVEFSKMHVKTWFSRLCIAWEFFLLVMLSKSTLSICLVGYYSLKWVNEKILSPHCVPSSSKRLQYTHQLSTVIRVWRGSMSGSPIRVPVLPSKYCPWSSTVCGQQGECRRVDTLPTWGRILDVFLKATTGTQDKRDSYVAGDFTISSGLLRCYLVDSKFAVPWTATISF